MSLQQSGTFITRRDRVDVGSQFSQRFLQKVKNVDVTVYDSNVGVGGTWYANNYPVSRLAQKVPIEHIHYYLFMI